MIELIDLNKTFKNKNGQIVALQNINLTIDDGDVYGIIGLSGAGKSTLVRCMNLLERPTSGRVVVDGEDLTAISQKRLSEVRRKIGMIFQSFNLLEQRTVFENVRFPLELEERANARKRRKKKKDGDEKNEKAENSRARMAGRVRELLGLVGLEDRENAYPSQLSGGQKQRVAIARALATNPRYLLCDEATSALDPNTTASILSLLREINKKLGVTVVVITHEMKVVESICTKVAVIDQSRIAEVGRVEDVFADPQSDIAKELILPDLIRSLKSGAGEAKLRLIFNGENSNEPVISALAIERGVLANVLFADMKDIDGKLYGHLVLSVRAEDEGKVTAFLKEKSVRFKKEVEL